MPAPTAEHPNGTKAATWLALSKVQAIVTLLGVVLAIGMSWGVSMWRIGSLEDTVKDFRTDVKDLGKRLEGFGDRLAVMSERVVRIEAWRDGPPFKEPH